MSVPIVDGEMCRRSQVFTRRRSRSAKTVPPARVGEFAHRAGCR
jgi:hypothetical protein